MRFLFFSSVFLVCLQFLGAGDCFYNFKPAFSKLKKERQSLNTFVKEGPALLLDGRHPSVGNHVGQTFYFPKKERDFLKGKNVRLKFKAMRLAGVIPLRAGFRILQRQVWTPIEAYSRSFKLEKKNVWYECEVPFSVPAHPQTGSNNINFAFGQSGRENTIIVVDEPQIFIDKESVVLKYEKCGSLGRAQRLNRKPLQLVRDGVPLFKIVLGAEPDIFARKGAEELQYHFFRATGKKPEIITGGTTPAPAIHIGDTPLSRRYGCTPSMLPMEHYVMARAGKDIILSGGDKKGVKKIPGSFGTPMGTLNAVYEFLEQFLGVRWYWPGEKGMVIPPCRELSVGYLHKNGAPRFNYRAMFGSHFPKSDEIPYAQQMLWKRRLRFGGRVISPIANHGFQWLVKKYADKKHLFALQRDGKRKNNADRGVHVCFSEPELLELTVKEALEFFRSNPDKSFFRVMPGDVFYGHVCNCSNCVKLLKPDRGESGAASDMVWGFINKVARRVAEKVPGKYIHCCAYENYKLPPSFPLAGNVSVTICHGGVPYAGVNEKKLLCNVLDMWEPSGAKIYIWEYWLIRGKRGSYGAPVTFMRHLQELYAIKQSRIEGGIIELSGRRADGTGAKGWGMWEYDLPSLYFAAKLMWDGDFDLEKELERFYTGFFGPAADLMRRFHENLENAWSSAYTMQEGRRFWNHQVCWEKMYPPAFVAEQMGLLKKALEVVKGQEPYQWRLKRIFNTYKGFEENSRLFSRKVKLNPSLCSVPRTDHAPLTDGKVGDKEWAKGALCTGFLDSFAVYPALSRTEVRLLHDKKFLYIGIKAFPAPGSEVLLPDQSFGKRDPALWFCDSVECFFASETGERYQFIFAAGDRVFDAYFSPRNGKLNAAWNSGVEVKSSHKGNAWECEAKIPLAELKFSPALPKGKFKVNFARNHYRRKKGEAKFFWEQTVWQPTYGAFANVDKFGTMTLK